jgi:hypothetical protein
MNCEKKLDQICCEVGPHMEYEKIVWNQNLGINEKVFGVKREAGVYVGKCVKHWFSVFVPYNKKRTKISSQSEADELLLIRAEEVAGLREEVANDIE